MQFHSKSIQEHNDVPLADDGQWEQLLNQFAKRHKHRDKSHGDPNDCYVVSVGDWRDSIHRDAQLAEILALVRAQGDRVVGHGTYRRVRPDPRTFVGRGAAEQIAERARASGADLLVIDAELSPSQTRNLEDVAGFSVCDREAVILNVFSRHASTRKAKIQIEIAHLEYLRPRIRGLGLNMDQQAGGIMRGRGPGETASELLARRLDGRLVELRKAFRRLARAGTVQRKGRDTCKRIALVGYTNAGKTSLMNALTKANLSARDRPFETLDTTSRCLTRYGGDVVISDTVGFIRRLPERLLASFESTLSEIVEASLLLVVVDIADPEREMHLATTDALLHKLGADRIPRIIVFNKLDRAPAPVHEQLEALSGDHPYQALSSRDADDVSQLADTLLHTVRQRYRQTRVFIPYHASGVMRDAYATCRVLDTEATERGLYLTLEGQPHVIAGIERAASEVQS